MAVCLKVNVPSAKKSGEMVALLPAYRACMRRSRANDRNGRGATSSLAGFRGNSRATRQRRTLRISLFRSRWLHRRDGNAGRTCDICVPRPGSSLPAARFHPFSCRFHLRDRIANVGDDGGGCPALIAPAPLASPQDRAGRNTREIRSENRQALSRAPYRSLNRQRPSPHAGICRPFRVCEHACIRRPGPQTRSPSSEMRAGLHMIGGRHIGIIRHQ